MAKHARKSTHLQLVERPKTTTVEILLPLLRAFGNIERSFFSAARSSTPKEPLAGFHGAGAPGLFPLDSPGTRCSSLTRTEVLGHSS